MLFILLCIIDVARLFIYMAFLSQCSSVVRLHTFLPPEDKEDSFHALTSNIIAWLAGK